MNVPIWDTPIDDETLYCIRCSIVEVGTDCQMCEGCVEDIKRDQMDKEAIFNQVNNSQNQAIVQLTIAMRALKQADVHLQNIAIDDEDIKAIVLYCEQSVRALKLYEQTERMAFHG